MHRLRTHLSRKGRDTNAVYRLNPSVNRRFNLERSQVLSKLRAKIGALQGKFHRGLQEPQRVSRIVAFPFESVSVNLFAGAEQSTKAISHLQFAACAKRGAFQRLNSGRPEIIPPDNGE